MPQTLGNSFGMLKNLREEVKEFLVKSDVALTIIAKKAGVPYGIVYRIKNSDADAKSEYMVSLYNYFTTPLKDNEQG